jgi:hypothetical protein
MFPALSLLNTLVSQNGNSILLISSTMDVFETLLEQNPATRTIKVVDMHTSGEVGCRSPCAPSAPSRCVV